MLPLD